MAKRFPADKRIIVNTTNSEDGEFEVIDRDRVIPGVHIPSEKFKANYDRIFRGKPEGDGAKPEKAEA